LIPAYLSPAGWSSALYLILIAVLAAVMRRRLKDMWKVIHWLNYVAFVLFFAISGCWREVSSSVLGSSGADAGHRRRCLPAQAPGIRRTGPDRQEGLSFGSAGAV